MRLILLIVVLLFTSCKNIITSTVGKYYVNHIHNKGVVDEKTFYTELPYEIKNNRIYLKIKLPKTQKEYSFIFDTGAHSSISESIIDEFEGEIMDYQFSTKDVNGNSVSQSVFCLDNIQLGSLEIKDKNIVVTSYSNKSFDGIIGSDMLKDKIFVFNPNTKKLIITNDKEVIDKDLFNSWRLKKRWDQKYFVKVRLDQKSDEYLLDTGHDGFLITNRNFSNSNIILNKKMKVGINGAYSVKSQDVNYIQLKDFEFNNILIDTANIMQVSFTGNNLGCEILNQGITVLDCIRDKIYFEKTLKIKSIGTLVPLQDISFGLFNEKIVVVQVNTELKNIDIKALDTLIEINNEKIEPKEYSKELIKEKALLSINHFVLERDGKKIEIDLTKKMLGL